MQRIPYPVSNLSTMVLTLCLFLFSALGAGAASVVVGINQDTIEISKSTLPDYDATVTQLEILRHPLHGTLGFTGPVALQTPGTPISYQPNTEFWSLGTDSFTYRITRADSTQVVSTLVLVAGRHQGQRVCHLNFEGNDLSGTGFGSATGPPSTHADAAITGAYSMRAFVPNSASSTDSSVTCTPPVISQREGSQMRVSVTVPDPASGVTQDTVLLSAATGQGDELLNLYLVLDQSTYSIHGEILNSTTQNFVATASWIVAPGAHKVYLDWWPDDPNNDAIGGLAIWGDDRFIDRIFEDQDFDVDDLVFTYGLQGYDRGTASIDMDDFEVWQGSVEAAFESLLTDSFESGLSAPWVPGPNTVAGLNVNQTAAITGTYGLESDLVTGYGSTEYLLDDDADGQTSFGARFQVNTEKSAMEPNDMVLLLDLLDQNSLGGATEHAKITFRKHNSSAPTFQLMGRARDGGTLVAGAWNDSVRSTVSNGVHTIELLWKAASSSTVADGYLRLWLDGVAVPGVNGLANHGRTVQSVILGTLGINSGSSGFLHLDEFESWSPTL